MKIPTNFQEMGRHRATLYRLHDGTKVTATFMQLTDALAYNKLQPELKLITVDLYENGELQTGDDCVAERTLYT